MTVPFSFCQLCRTNFGADLKRFEFQPLRIFNRSGCCFLELFSHDRIHVYSRFHRVVLLFQNHCSEKVVRENLPENGMILTELK